MKVRTKLVLLGILPTLIAAGVIGALSVFFHTRTLTQEIIKAGKSFTETLTDSLVLPLVTNDITGIEEIVRSYGKTEPILGVLVFTPDGDVITYHPKVKGLVEQFKSKFDKEIEEKAGTPQRISIYEYSLSSPIKIYNKSFSSFYIVHSSVLSGTAGHIFVLMPTAFDVVIKTQKKLAVLTAVIALAVVIGAILVAVMLGLSLARKITYLSEAAENMSLGDLDTPIELEDKDELGLLASSLETMRQSMKSAIERLRKRK